MKTKKPMARALALTLILASSPVIGGEGEATVLMKPLMATSHASGSKHILSFFVNGDGACNLTVMISELENDQAEPPGSRMHMAIDPLKSSRLDIADGKSLEFVCGQSASTMIVSSIDRLSYLERK